MAWEDYFQKQRGRPVRPFYKTALNWLPKEGVDRLTAIDLGCGAGTEAVDLLDRGWNVIAIDGEQAAMNSLRALASTKTSNRLKSLCINFEEISELERADFIYSYHSLPFCSPDHLDGLWNSVENALKPNGIFAGSFFGLKDDWVKSGETTGLSEEKLNQYFASFEILHREEKDGAGTTALRGPKYWHYFEIIARKIG